ncbi:MAG: phosphoribosylanthranilate isomerase [Bacteroidetes bacterium]|nr:phosphoribosylanthranilate isomerase [Bacteroidota bacterium]
MQYKVCGITQVEQANALDSMGVDYIGFIFYPLSKRYVLNSLSIDDLAKLKPTHAKKVGVFVNETAAKVLEIVEKAKLDLVQLHGEEDVDYCKLIEKVVPVIKVFRVGNAVPDFNAFEQAASYYLFDTDTALYGGTGQHFNWELIKNTTIQKPYFLSGGIGPHDVQGIEVMQKTKAGKDLMAIDINSQFETIPGIKNLEMIKTFIDVHI